MRNPMSSAKTPKPDRVLVENVMSPGRTYTVDANKYSAMKAALFKVLPKKGYI